MKHCKRPFICAGITALLVFTCGVSANCDVSTEIAKWEAPAPLLTVKYHVMERDTVTPAMVQYFTANKREQYNRDVKTNTMTKQAASAKLAHMVKGLASAPHDRSFDVTVSTKNGKLYYHQQWLGKDSRLIYDGAATYSMDDELYIEPGFRVDRLQGFIQPGIGVECMPMMKLDPHNITAEGKKLHWKGLAPVVGARGENGLMYLDADFTGEVVAGTMRIDSVSEHVGDDPRQRIEYLSYVKIGDRWIASHIKLTNYMDLPAVNGGVASHGNEFSTVDARLVAARLGAVPDKDFNYLNWLKQNTLIQDKRGGKLVNFGYNTARGTIEEQSTQAFREQDRQAKDARTGFVYANTSSGLYLLGCLVFIFGGWRLWQRIQRNKT